MCRSISLWEEFTDGAKGGLGEALWPAFDDGCVRLTSLGFLVSVLSVRVTSVAPVSRSLLAIR